MKQLSKELLESTIADLEAARDEIPFGLGEEGDNTLAALRFALAGMAHEPVAWHQYDSKALELARRVMAIMYGPMPIGGSVQLQAQVQCLFVEAMQYAAPPSPAVPDAWIPCSERMPDDDTYVVAADIGHGEIYSAFAARFIHGRFSVMEGLSASNYDGGAMIEIDMPITHWQPLPAPPKDGK